MLTVIARIEARPEFAACLKQAMLALLATTRAEPGCLAYELLESSDDPALIFFHERWADRDALEAHWQSAHLLAYRDATKGWIERRELSVLHSIES